MFGGNVYDWSNGPTIFTSTTIRLKEEWGGVSWRARRARVPLTRDSVRQFAWQFVRQFGLMWHASGSQGALSSPHLLVASHGTFVPFLTLEDTKALLVF